MSDRSLRFIGRLLAGAAVVGALIASAVILSFEGVASSLNLGAAHHLAWAVGIGALAWVAMATQERNLEVWTLAVAALCSAVGLTSLAAFNILAPPALRELNFDELVLLTPSDLPADAAIAFNPYIWIWAPAFVLVLTLGLLLFPDGRPPSPRWRWLGWLSLGLLAFASFGAMATYRPSGTVEYGATGDPSDVIVLLAVIAVVVGCVASLIVRYRRSTGATRRQILWIAWAGAILAVALVFTVVEQETDLIDVSESASILILGVVGEGSVILAFWIALTRYRLYDIDIVISRTVTYGALAVFITATYVAIVVGVGTLVGAGDEPNLALAIGATAVVALLFQPVRSGVQHWANRLVYGKRATPYETLARFSKRAATAESDDEVLGRIPRLIVDGTGATQATLWTASNGELVPTASWPDAEERAEADYSVPVEHQGEVLGALTMSAGRGETIAPAEEELVQNLASGLGLALRNARLTDDLRAQVDELAASRERILSAADAARRDLERDLDMGPQQELVAVKVKLGVVRARAEARDAGKTAEVLGQLEADTGIAIESVRDFARGVYPPLLEAEGLAAAISAEGAKSPLPMTMQATEVGRYPREIETAVFFSILEALQNAAKYSGATTVAVTLTDDGEQLTFTVSDNGRGFDPRSVDAGSGLPGMADRLDAAGGELRIDSARGEGTVVSGSVPL